MTQKVLEKTDRTTLHRVPERVAYDRETLDAILDEGVICHVGFAVEGKPYVIPMAYARWDDRVLLHGSVISRLVEEVGSGVEVCVTVTHLDGLVLARSAFHHSMNYRSVVLFGRAVPITDDEEKHAALDALVEHLIPGRTRDARAANEKEFNATEVLALPIEEGSAKIRTGPPSDNKADMDLDCWAGVIPLTLTPGEVETAPDLKAGVEMPDYVAHYRRPGKKT